MQRLSNLAACICLAAIGVGTSIRHGQQSGNVVLVLKILISEFRAVDALAAGSVVISEVASLKHKSWNYAVKAGALVAAGSVIQRAETK